MSASPVAQHVVSAHLDRYVGRSAFRVCETPAGASILVNAAVRSAETLSVSAAREPFECFLSTFRIKQLLAKAGGIYPGDAPSFVSAFIRSFDENAPLQFGGAAATLNPHLLGGGGGARSRLTASAASSAASSLAHSLVRVMPDEGQEASAAAGVGSAPKRSESGQRTIKVRVTVLWTPRMSAHQTVENACSFDLHLVQVEAAARDSFSWLLINDCVAQVRRLSAAAHRNNKLERMEDEEMEVAEGQRQKKHDAELAALAVGVAPPPVAQNSQQAAAERAAREAMRSPR